MGDDGQLRIGLTISGAIALGAYEGGALAALLVALQRINEQREGAVRVDAISGASAGSITGVLAARALLEGYDPVDAMYRSWVEEPQLSKLRGTGRNDPLTVDGIAELAGELLDPENEHREPRGAQTTEIRMDMALGCLRGLDYTIARPGAQPNVRAETFLDWGEFTFEHGSTKEEFVRAWRHGDPNAEPGESAVEVALASGAHALAFPARRLRRGRDRERYEQNGITNFPATDLLWYTDGGTINNQPLGHTLDIVGELDGGEDPLPEDGSRLLLLIDPDPEAPPGPDSDLWASPAHQPKWTRTLARVLQLVASQHLYDDLRQVEKTNSRLRWTGELQDVLVELLADDERAVARLREVLESIGDDKDELARRSREAPDPASLRGAELIRRVLHEATGLSKKREVGIDVISPRLVLEDGDPPNRVKERLAGEFLGHFGGFLDEPLRHSDFVLGYDSVRSWLGDGRRGLAAHGVAPELVELACAAVDERRARLRPEPDPALGRINFRDLSWRVRLPFYRLIGRIARISLREWRASRRDRRGS